MPGQYTDRELVCVDCSTSFTFTSGEQEHYAQLGFTNDPKRCGPCRIEKKKRNGGPGGAGGRGPGGPRGGMNPGPKEYHVATCAECGGEAKVPFRPRGDRPVYCSSCFQNRA